MDNSQTGRGPPGDAWALGVVMLYMRRRLRIPDKSTDWLSRHSSAWSSLQVQYSSAKAGCSTADPEDAEPCGGSGLSPRRTAGARPLARSCFLRGWEFDGGLWGALVRFELVWLWLKLDVKLVAKLMAGLALMGKDRKLASILCCCA